MEVFAVLGLAVVCSFITTGEAIICYTCLYMDVEGGANYGDANCKKSGSDFTDTNPSTRSCLATENLQPNQVYYNQEKPWNDLLVNGEPSGYDGWLCQDTKFTMSGQGGADVDVWYRGCQPAPESQAKCPVDKNNYFIEQDIFKDIYEDITSVPLADVTIDGDVCLCKYANCNDDVNASAAPCVWRSLVFVGVLVNLVFYVIH